MKKTVFVTMLVLASFMAQAGTEIGLLAKRAKRTRGLGDGMVSNGFYLNLGFGFTKASTSVKLPIVGYTDYTDPVSTGMQISFELGNQWMFYKSTNDKFGIGMNVSWLTLGYNSYEVSSLLSSRTNVISLSLFRLGPMASFSFHEKMAIDAYFNAIPTGVVSLYDDGFTKSTFGGGGVMFAPGFKYRFSILAVGFEYQFGTVFGPQQTELLTTTIDSNIKYRQGIPRVTIGLKF